MKTKSLRINHVILLFLMFTMAVSSCKKNEDDIIQEQEKNYRLAENPINELVQNPFDGEDEKVNMQLLNVAEDLRNAIDSKQLVLTSELNEMPIANLSINFKSGTVKINYQGIAYKSGITIINNETCDFSMEPIIAIGTDVFIGDSINGEYIPGMKKNELGIWEEILINEEQAMATKAPVVIINALNTESQVAKLECETTEVNDYPRLKSNEIFQYRLRITEINLSQRFEKTGDSQFYISWNGGSWGANFIQNHIWDIGKNDINITFTRPWFDFYVTDALNLVFWEFSNAETKTIYAATYERDWYASKKTVYVSGKYVPFYAKYSNEYYHPMKIVVGIGSQSYAKTFHGNGHAKVAMIKNW